MCKNSTSFKKGHPGYWKGKISHRRNGENRTCLHCDKEFYVARWQIKKGEGKFCSRLCSQKHPISDSHRENLSESHRGEKSATWRGGVTKKYYKRLANYKWKMISKSIFERDGYSCQKCLQKFDTKDLACHHMTPYRYCGGDENVFIFWSVKINDNANLISLCKSCHTKEDWIIRKREERGEYGFTPVLHTIS